MNSPVLECSLLEWERQLWDGGYARIAGVDEVGRGALAGPLVAAAVILPDHNELEADPFWRTIADSKVLGPKRRTELARLIHQSSAVVSIAEVSVAEIDAIGLGAANRTAMERAVLGLSTEPDMLVIDAMTLDLDTPQVGIIDGDACSMSIAAASIVAKVHRDALMVAYEATHGRYGFAKHKGYGVATHLTALSTHGPCEIHRQSFAPVRAARMRHGQN